MKQMSFEQMEEVKGGMSCFFAVPYWLLMFSSGNPALMMSGNVFAAYCWAN